MSFKFIDLKEDIKSDIRDNTDANITVNDIKLKARAALRRLVRHRDIPTGKYKYSLKAYRGVYRYAVPTAYHDFDYLMRNDVLNDSLNVERVASEAEFFRNFPQTQNRVSESRDGATRTLLLSLNGENLNNILLHSCDSYDGNGTWTANTTSSDALNVRNDQLYTSDGSGSVAFDIDVSQSVNDYAEIAVPDMSSVDLSGEDLFEIAGITMDVYLPSLSSALTSFTLRMGSSASVYYDLTVTTQAGGAAFSAGWNHLIFDWSLMTETGAVDEANIDYLMFRVNYSSSMTDLTGVRIDNIQARQPEILTLGYSSYYLVLDKTTGEPKEEFEDDDDILNVDIPYVDVVLAYIKKQIFTYHVEDDFMKAEAEEELQEAENDLDQRFPATRQQASSQGMEEPNLQDFLV